MTHLQQKADLSVAISRAMIFVTVGNLEFYVSRRMTPQLFGATTASIVIFISIANQYSAAGVDENKFFLSNVATAQ